MLSECLKLKACLLFAGRNERSSSEAKFGSSCGRVWELNARSFVPVAKVARFSGVKEYRGGEQIYLN